MNVFLNATRCKARLFLLSWHYVESSAETISHWLMPFEIAEVVRIVGKSRLVLILLNLVTRQTVG